MMNIVLDICLITSVISLNALLWANWYVRYVKSLPTEGAGGYRTGANENEEEQRKKDKLAKEWANMMNYNGIGGGGDE